MNDAGARRSPRKPDRNRTPVLKSYDPDRMDETLAMRSPSVMGGMVGVGSRRWAI